MVSFIYSAQLGNQRGNSMLDHHIQQHIVHKLAFVESLRFGQLKPDEIDNKLFTYHLKKVMAAGLITKQADGAYTLTAEGRRLGKNATKRPPLSIERAYSILLLGIKDNNRWLLFKRGTHPSIGLYGFMQASPSPYKSILETAHTTCKQETNLDVQFSVQGSGFFRLHHETELESFIHFTLLNGTRAQGELRQNSQLGEYEWREHPDFSGSDMLPNMQTLHKMSVGAAGSFVDESFHL